MKRSSSRIPPRRAINPSSLRMRANAAAALVSVERCKTEGRLSGELGASYRALAYPGPAGPSLRAALLLEQPVRDATTQLGHTFAAVKGVSAEVLRTSARRSVAARRSATQNQESRQLQCSH